jgi:hypothetical protein
MSNGVNSNSVWAFINWKFSYKLWVKNEMVSKKPESKNWSIGFHCHCGKRVRHTYPKMQAIAVMGANCPKCGCLMSGAEGPKPDRGTQCRIPVREQP